MRLPPLEKTYTDDLVKGQSNVKNSIKKGVSDKLFKDAFKEFNKGYIQIPLQIASTHGLKKGKSFKFLDKIKNWWRSLMI